ncbi:MAG TPA: hypothetical protein VEY69_11445, partial [Lautropia sp.]|nr:hypothetical protein [Lautropia sp.]
MNKSASALLSVVVAVILIVLALKLLGAVLKIVARYPAGRQMSASIPFLDLAQRQVGAETNTQGWLPIPV